MTGRARELVKLEKRFLWASGTLRSALSNIRIGDGIDGCEAVVAHDVRTAETQIARITELLSDIRKLLPRSLR